MTGERFIDVPTIIVRPPNLHRDLGLAGRLRELGFRDVRETGVGPDVMSTEAVHRRLDQRGARIHSGAALTPEQVACCISHEMAILEEALPSGATWSIILEDDALVDDRLTQFATGLADVAPSEPTIISLFSMGRSTPTFRQPGQAVGGHDLRRLTAPPASAVGYAINRPAAEVVQNFSSWPIFCRADWPLWGAMVTFYLCDQPVVGHEDQRSTMLGIPESPRGLRRILRGLLKVTGTQFVLHPSSYGSDVSLYFRHAVWPSATFGIYSSRRRLVESLRRVRYSLSRSHESNLGVPS